MTYKLLTNFFPWETIRQQKKVSLKRIDNSFWKILWRAFTNIARHAPQRGYEYTKPNSKLVDVGVFFVPSRLEDQFLQAKPQVGYLQF